MKLKKALSQRIRSLREAAGLSQQDVAVKGDLSLSLVAKLEQGKKADPRASTLLALAHALGVRPGQLLDDLFVPEPDHHLVPRLEPVANGQGQLHGSDEGADTTNGVGHDAGKKAKKKKKESKKRK